MQVLFLYRSYCGPDAVYAWVIKYLGEQLYAVAIISLMLKANLKQKIY